MENLTFVEQLLKPFGPTLPIPALIVEMNRLYHSFEASDYDHSHPEIHGQLPPLWSEMVEKVLTRQPDMEWDVLDFGCGTGFASSQVLSNVEKHRIRSLTCFDPSPEMVSHCRAKLRAIAPNLRTMISTSQLPVGSSRFNVLVTNSVLHHLPDTKKELESLSQLLTPNAVWLCGHEPSRRYYQNRACIELMTRFQRRSRWKRFLQPRSYVNRLSRVLGLRRDPAKLTARAAYQAHLFRRQPSVLAVSRMVDFHVAHSEREANSGRGFDIQQLQEDLQESWVLEWYSSYNFLGPVWPGYVNAAWQSHCKRLQEEFPGDGANFCSVWRRRACEAKAAA